MKMDRDSEWIPAKRNRPEGPAWSRQALCVSAAVMVLVSSPRLARAATPLEAESTAEARRTAAALLDDRRYDEALPILNGLLAADPQDAGSLSLRGQLYKSTARNDEARADYALLTTLRPHDPEPWFWLATLDRWKGDTGRAIEEYTQALAVSPCHLDALKGRAMARHHAGDIPGTEVDLRVAIKCRPEDAEAAGLLADLLAKQGRGGEAEEVLRQGLSGLVLEKQLGDLALSANRPSEAADHYARVLSANPNDLSGLRGMAEAERQRGRTRESLERLRSILKIDPQDSGALYWVGILAPRLGLRAEAMNAFDTTLARRPDDPGALVGKARLLRSEGRSAEALTLVEKALAASPGNGEARVLHAALLASAGRTVEARAEYRDEVRNHPDNSDALIGLDRLGPARAVSGFGRSNRTDVVEGLDEAGLEFDGYRIIPTRIRYLTEGGGVDFDYQIRDGLELTSTFSLQREAVSSLSRDYVIYDFDVASGAAGFTHGLAAGWELAWSVGGTRYDARKTGTIDAQSRFAGEVRIRNRAGRMEMTAEVSRSSFIQRGFAGDYQFRIFDRDRASLAVSRPFAGGYTAAASASLSHYDDGSTPFFLSAGLTYGRGERTLSMSYRHDPFPARFFGADLRLEFIDLDVLSIRGRLPLRYGVELAAEGSLGRYGATSRTLYEDTDHDGIAEKINGPFDNNIQRTLRTSLSWTPLRIKVFRIGAEYLSDDYDFNTGPYNTPNVHQWSFFAELNGELPGRLSYAARYSRGEMGDERDPQYGSNTYQARLDARLGDPGRDAGPWRISCEGRFKDNGLDEQWRSFSGYLTIPF